MRHTIGLPDGRSVTVREYVRSWRILKTLPPDRLVNGFYWFPETADTILHALRAGIHDRINRHLPGYGQGRKWNPQWQADMARASRDLNRPRLVIRWLPSDLKVRFPHRLTQAGE